MIDECPLSLTKADISKGLTRCLQMTLSGPSTNLRPAAHLTIVFDHGLPLHRFFMPPPDKRGDSEDKYTRESLQWESVTARIPSEVGEQGGDHTRHHVRSLSAFYVGNHTSFPNDMAGTWLSQRGMDLEFVLAD